MTPSTTTGSTSPEPSDPGHGPAARALRAQSLAHGTVGTALPHIERAHRGLTSWADAHTLLTSCTKDLLADETASLYVGAPAIAFALHTAARDTGRYTGALHALDSRITRLTRQRVHAAHIRIDRQIRPRVGEFDLFYGLTGLGSYLLSRDPAAPAMREVLTYLVRLTLPLEHDPDQLPGWWTDLDPSGSRTAEFPGGHGNLGMAHGVGGILSLLAIAARAGAVVDGQNAAMKRICAWLDRWRQGTETSPWWPQWITWTEHRTGTVKQTGPLRPSWCYGTPGLARAQQLAALALGDTDRQRLAEHALLACLSDPDQLGRIRDAGICHGAAGLLHTTHRVARDATATGFDAHLPGLRTLLLKHPADDDGFLDGEAGRALALLTAQTHGATASGWDACLLSG
ncbi:MULTISPECIES: lanthionine synthetase C family protein [Streptomyces]|uniref:lanthionine synthetase C family protein n=1 Tax=Streptomyces TaxID=1883 RepID=UPI00224949FF|nr:lanthionine synthetase C family protein [Streptomyces sp. JHD 1]MCX2968613.1 lanthionine synthetase C family protein [Streptomyces sp. JHD 1]